MSTSPETTTSGHDRARFCHLPPDILYRIASKLPPKEFARTSVLSTEWRGCATSACPRLTFDAVAMCKCEREDLELEHVCQFVSEVNNILRKHGDKVLETLEVRINLEDEDSVLLGHNIIDTWLHFAVALWRAKNLTLDLRSVRFWEYKNLYYAFPFKLLGRESISRLQHMQLSYVTLNNPPSWFKGFPNLRRLHLAAAPFDRKNLEHMLSHCHTLEWLCIDRCSLDDELTVDSPLSRLLYLRVECARLSKIKFNAANLATFEYDGSFVPIDLVHSFKLQSANFRFLDDPIVQHVLTSLLHGLPSVQNLTLNFTSSHLEKQWLWDNPLKFSNLRHLQLLMYIWPEQIDTILYLVSFLRATPFIEKLEVHFSRFRLWLAEVGPHRTDLGQCKYNYLKDIWITGFQAARGQVEFLSHVVENAPVLEVVLVKIGRYTRFDETLLYRGHEPPIQAAKEIARTCLRTKLSSNVTFNVED